jgi:arylsulfatase A-like enzyme
MYNNCSVLLLSLVLAACTSSKTGDSNADSVSNASQPNIIIMMADDLGYSDIGCFGSEISTPNLDRLASEGIKFTRFYNASVCCPSRASLMTGLYSHQAGVGLMDSDLGYESYQGRIKHSVSTLAEALSDGGYSTIMSGKWHLGTRAGDNPWERGFHNFYGIPKGGGVYFWPPKLDRPVVVFDREDGQGPVTTEPDSSTFYSTDAFTDYAVRQLAKAKNDGKPFFMYIPYIAPHFPQQASEADIRRYLEMYEKGWHTLRNERYARQLSLGIIDDKHPLPPGEELQWQSLSADERKKFARQMAVYAAQVDVLDQNVGKILDALSEHQLADNTMVIFLSDNGAQQNSEEGFEQNPEAVFGSRESFGGYARSWANLSNTPFRRFKHEQHNGGNATPLIVRWPGVLAENETSEQAGHIIDIFPTCLAAAGINRPDDELPLPGINLIPYFKNTTLGGDRELFWEHRGNRAVRVGDWKLVASFGNDWELYNLKDDVTELKDLSADFLKRFVRLKRNTTGGPRAQVCCHGL